MERKKYVLLRPRGGLADTLHQIGLAAMYCQRFSRKLLIDTRKSGLQDKFENYFYLSKECPFEYETVNEATHSYLNEIGDVHPKSHTGSIFRYDAKESLRGATVRLQPQNDIVDFDQASAYPETLLVRERGGGGLTGIRYLLPYLRLQPAVMDTINERLSQLPTGYVSVHVRATDIRVDVDKTIEKLNVLGKGKHVVVCTDNSDVFLEILSRAHSPRSVVQLANIDRRSGEPLHLGSIPDVESNNLEMLLDLIAMARSRMIIFGLIDASYNTLFTSRISGFARLAIELNLRFRLSQGFVWNESKAGLELYKRSLAGSIEFLRSTIFNLLFDHKCGRAMLSIYIRRA